MYAHKNDANVNKPLKCLECQLPFDLHRQPDQRQHHDEHHHEDEQEHQAHVEDEQVRSEHRYENVQHQHL